MKFIRIASVFLLFACNSGEAPDCFKKAGDAASEWRAADPFHSIELRDFIQVELVDSTGYAVKVSGPKNLLSKIRTEVSEGVLYVENENTCNFVRSFRHRITVRICAPEFPNIQNYGTGDIACVNTIEAPYFLLENRTAAGDIELNIEGDSVAVNTHTGVCDVRLRGEVDVVKLFNQGLGIIDARALQAADAYVNNSSINDVYVRSTSYLYAFIQYSGTIFYGGDPALVDTDIEGSGALVPID